MKLAILLVATAILLSCGASKKSNTQSRKAATNDSMATADNPMTPADMRAPPAARRAAPATPDATAAPAAPGKTAGAGAKTPEALGQLLVEAIHKGDEARALKLVPTRAEFGELGFKGPASEQGYAKFVAKRRRGFAKVIKKHRRKHPSCAKLVFSRMKKEKPRKMRKADSIPSVDLFAKCDGTEIWVADPDFLVKTSGGWRLLEFN